MQESIEMLLKSLKMFSYIITLRLGLINVMFGSKRKIVTVTGNKGSNLENCKGFDKPIQCMSVLPLYRNQSIDLHSKSIGWFLYECNTGI